MKNLLCILPLQAILIVILSVTMMPSLQAGPIGFSFQTLNNSGDPAFNQLLGINHSGVIAGYFGDGVTQPNKGYTLSPPYGAVNYTNQNFPGSAQTQVVGINSAGSTVGFWVDAGGNNFGYTDFGGTFTSVSTSSFGGTVNQLLGVNDAGKAVGFLMTALEMHTPTPTMEPPL